MRQIVLLALVVNLAVLDVCCGLPWPFSATQNLTIQPYEPYSTFSRAQIQTFDVDVTLTNASFFNLGPALVRTYLYSEYKNYTVPMPGVIYNGPYLKENKYTFHKAINPCTMLTTSNSAVDFPEAWTNAQEGTFQLKTGYDSLDTIAPGLHWSYNIDDCNQEGTECVSYLMWQRVMHKTLILQASLSENTISDVLQRVTFRQIGSRSCPQNGEMTTNDDYSFSIDFTTTHVSRRTVLLRDLPQNASFIISVTTNMEKAHIFPSFILRSPSVTFEDNTTHFSDFFYSYWTYIVSGALSLSLLLASSIAILVLKYRQRRALRAEYENIPDNEAINNKQPDSKE
jgi:hypothetical protein